MIEGEDFDVLTGADLREFLALFATEGSSVAKVRHLTILYEGGVDTVCLKTDKPTGRRLRRYLKEKVLPKLRRREVIVPGLETPPVFAPEPAALSAAGSAELVEMHAELRALREEVRALVPRPAPLSPPESGADMLREAIDRSGMTDARVAHEVFRVSGATLSIWLSKKRQKKVRPDNSHRKMAESWAGIPPEAWETAEERADQARARALPPAPRPPASGESLAKKGTKR